MGPGPLLADRRPAPRTTSDSGNPGVSINLTQRLGLDGGRRVCSWLRVQLAEIPVSNLELAKGAAEPEDGQQIARPLDHRQPIR